MKKTILLILSILLFSSAWAYDFSVTAPSGQMLYYNITSSANHTVEVTCPGSSSWYGYSQPTGSLSIPTSVTKNGITYSVTSIGANAFKGCSGLTSVNIPNSVTSIGNNAFSYCSGLTSVTIPNSVTSIGANPFRGCSGLTSINVNSGNTIYDSRNNCNAIIKTSTNELIVGCKNSTIPNTVISIGNYAFFDYRTGTSSFSITIPSSVTLIGNYAFYSSGLASVTIPNSITSIGSNAFSSNELTSITIPNSVTSIGNSAFSSCSLTSITIPNSVTFIGLNPFSGCSNLTSINVDSGNTVYDSRDNCNAIINTSTNELITGCNNTTIPNSVTSIGNSAFYSCDELTTVTIPNSVTSIEEWAFSYCRGLTSVTIPNSVSSIGDYAFSYCNGLTSFIIGSGVTSIEPNALQGSYQLNTVTCYANNSPYISGNNTSFCNCGHTVNTLIVPCGRQNYYTSWSSFFNQTNCFYYYTLTALSNNASYGSVTGSGSYASGSYATLTAIANSNYHFTQWNDNDTTNPRTIQINGNVTYTAYFEPEVYIISISSNNTEWGTVSGGGNYDYGSTATITASPQDHYHFDHWSDNDTTNPRNLLVSGDITLTAFFVIDQHSVVVTSNNNNWGSVFGGGYYDYGSTATITAIPLSHYHFERWSDNVTTNPRIFQVNSNSTYTSIFAPNSYTITLNSNNNSWGTVAGSGNYDYGSTATITAIPQSNYHFERWSDNVTTNPRNMTVRGDTTLTAIFAINYHSLAITSNNTNWGAVSGAGNYEYGSQVIITATPINNHYYFVRWSDGNTDASRTITLLSDTLFTAYFGIKQYTVTATSANPDMGFVTGDGTYDYGSTATIQAIPFYGYQFLQWDNGNINSTHTFRVDHDTSLIAFFAQVNDIENPQSTTQIPKLNIFPNPASDWATIEHQGLAIPTHLTITDILGRKILSDCLETPEYTFFTTNMPQGTYFVKVVAADGTTIVKKIIVE